MKSVELQAGDIREMYDTTRAEGLNAEVKRRILMGSYALSAGYYDAFYKRAQQVLLGALSRTHNIRACFCFLPRLHQVVRRTQVGFLSTPGNSYLHKYIYVTYVEL